MFTTVQQKKMNTEISDRARPEKVQRVLAVCPI